MFDFEPAKKHGKPSSERRNFIECMMGFTMGLCAFPSLHVRHASANAISNKLLGREEDIVCDPLFPLFCTAYITPDVPDQAGQENLVARYPLAIVPQDNRYASRRWRDSIKNLNPDICFLGYQMVMEETTSPGPGHKRLSDLKGAWSRYPWGTIPTVGPSWKRRRIFDPRSRDWQSAFLNACSLTLSSYPYDGLFLDQCAVFNKAHPLQSVRDEMRASLADTLIRLRKLFPDKLLVANSASSWSGLNGELCENRPDKLFLETRGIPGHVLPRVELLQTIIDPGADIQRIKRDMFGAHALGCGFGVAHDYQHVLWFDFFDEVLDTYRHCES